MGRLHRTWSKVKHDLLEPLHTLPSIFTILNWNILAPQFVTPERYGECQEASLLWGNRKHAVIAEIQKYVPDIIALQEVNDSIYKKWLKPKLESYGYDGTYVAKTSSNHDEVDGIATFWKTNRFMLVKNESVHFAINEFLDKPQVANLTLLQDVLYPEERLLVANTHLLFNIKRGDIKLGQMILLLVALWKAVNALAARSTVAVSTLCHSYSENYEKCQPLRYMGNGGSVPVLQGVPGIIMCGDFNITPNSCIYEYLRNSYYNFSTYNNAMNCRLSGQYLMQYNMHHINRGARRGRGTSPMYKKKTTFYGDNSQIVLEKRKHEEDSFTSKSDYITNSTDICIPQSNRWTEFIFPLSHRNYFTQPSVSWLFKNDNEDTHSVDNCRKINHRVLHRQTGNEEGFDPARTSSNSILQINCDNKRSRHASNSNTSSIRKKNNLKYSGLPQENFSNNISNLYHPFELRSAYATTDAINETPCEPAVTAYNGWQKGCIDYIWYSPHNLQVSRILEFPHLTELEKFGSIPNKAFPGSDHFDLIAEFCWITPKCRRLAILLNEASPNF